jgi:hypothetical protein
LGILFGAFFSGMVEGEGREAQVIDGGEVYALRTVEQFATHYEWRKYTIAGEENNSPNIPASLRPLWPDRVSISYGVNDTRSNKTPAVQKITLENALNRCDDYVWMYSEYAAPTNAYKYLEPGGAPVEWINAIRDAKAAAKKRTIGILATTAPLNVPMGNKFGYKVKYYNYTGSPVTFSFPNNPSWITNATDSIYGTAPTVPKMDTLTIIATAGAYKDTAKLAIRVAWYYSLEAESGAIIAPMQIKSDISASGGKYISTPAGTGTAVTPTTEASYPVNVPVSGNYYVWLLMYSPATSQTGIYAAFNNNSFGNSTSLYQQGKYVWVMGVTPHALSAGANVLKIGHRHEQVRVDKIIITSTPVAALPSIVPANTGLLAFSTSSKLSASPVLGMTASSQALNFEVYLKEAGSFSLRTYDISGKKIWEQTSPNSSAGLKEISIKKSSMENGVYFTRLTANNIHSVIKYSIMK